MVNSPIAAVPLPNTTSTDQVPADLLTAFTSAEKLFVNRFASASARDTAIPAPVKGMVAWLDSPGCYSEYLASGWKNRYQTGVQSWTAQWPSTTLAGTNSILTVTTTINPQIGPYLLTVNIGMQTALVGSGVPVLEMWVRGAIRDQHRFIGVTSTTAIFSGHCGRQLSVPDGGSSDIYARLNIPAGVTATTYADDSSSFVSISAVPM